MYSPTLYLRTIVTYGLVYALACIVAWFACMPRRRLGRHEGFGIFCTALTWIALGIFLISG
jgi:hypothetical protein